jgi:DNA helicase HerA-like ATPase
VLDELDIAEISADVLIQIRLKIVLQYHHEIINGFSSSEHLSPLLKRIGPRINDLRKVIEVKDARPRKNITVISFRDVNIHMRKMLPLLICKQLYERKKEENQKDKYLNIIIDEAHNILSSTSERESETWKDYRLETFEEIIKEGRKFGVFLTIASQRPYDISATIISQLHNFFLHRLINNNDITAVERSVSYLDRLSFESLPILPTGTCILAGLSAQVPVMIDIGSIEQQFEPDNKTMRIIDKWK